MSDTRGSTVAKVARRNMDARNVLALFYRGYEKAGGRNFVIRPDAELLAELGMERRAYVEAIGRLVDKDLLKLSGTGHGASITVYGVEVHEAGEQLERELPLPALTAELFRRLVVQEHIAAYDRAVANRGRSTEQRDERTLCQRVLDAAGPRAKDYHFDEALRWMETQRWVQIGATGDVTFNAGHIAEMRAYVDPLTPDEGADDILVAVREADPGMRVVMLSSSPDEPGLERLALDTEYNRIRSKLESSEGGRRVELDYWPDVRVDQLPDRLLKAPADVLHFSGHSTEDGAITMRDADGQILDLQPEGVAQVIGAFGDRLRCVVLVACFSAELAQRLQDHIDVVVGMQSEVDDDAAIVFVSTFYNALAQGHAVRRAFDVAAGMMRAHGNLTGEPILYTREGVDPTALVIGDGS